MISNVRASSNPIENPFNSSSLAVAQSIGHISRGPDNDPSKLTVPESIPYAGFGSQSNGLVPPNQDVPPGDQLRGNGFIPSHSNLFRLSNGVVLDFKSRKIVFDPTSKYKNTQYWDDPDRTMSFGHENSYGPAEKEFDDAIAAANGQNACSLAVDMQIDPQSAKYWLQAEEEAQKMITSMTDDQKKLIADFEKHFPKSRLVEESMKCK